jgi:hypothetical protein
MQVLQPHHQPLLPYHTRRSRVSVSLRLHEVTAVQTLQHDVEQRDHLGRVVYELQVQLLVELAQVPTLHLEHSQRLVSLEVVQLAAVHLLPHQLLLHDVGHRELEDETLDTVHHPTHLHRRAVDYAVGVVVAALGRLGRALGCSGGAEGGGQGGIAYWVLVHVMIWREGAINYLKNYFRYRVFWNI